MSGCIHCFRWYIIELLVVPTIFLDRKRSKKHTKICYSIWWEGVGCRPEAMAAACVTALRLGRYRQDLCLERTLIRHGGLCVTDKENNWVHNRPQFGRGTAQNSPSILSPSCDFLSHFGRGAEAKCRALSMHVCIILSLQGRHGSLLFQSDRLFGSMPLTFWKLFSLP